MCVPVGPEDMVWVRCDHTLVCGSALSQALLWLAVTFESHADPQEGPFCNSLGLYQGRSQVVSEPQQTRGQKALLLGTEVSILLGKHLFEGFCTKDSFPRFI